MSVTYLLTYLHTVLILEVLSDLKKKQGTSKLPPFRLEFQLEDKQTDISTSRADAS